MTTDCGDASPPLSPRGRIAVIGLVVYTKQNFHAGSVVKQAPANLRQQLAPTGQ